MRRISARVDGQQIRIFETASPSRCSSWSWNTSTLARRPTSTSGPAIAAGTSRPGSCLAFVHFPVAAFTWLTQEPSRYESSRYATRGFCPDCGSTLSMHEAVLGDRVQVTLGSLDCPQRVRPQDHVWVRSRIPWFEVADDLPRFERSSTAVASQAEDDDSLF